MGKNKKGGGGVVVNGTNKNEKPLESQGEDERNE